MAQYRGRHSFPNEDTHPTNQQRGDSSFQAGSRLVPSAGIDVPTRAAGPNRQRRVPAQSDLPQRSRRDPALNDLPPRNRRSASPSAFRHHAAVHETGTRPRHSVLKTVLIVVPIVAVLAIALFLLFPKISAVLQEEPIEPGVAVTVEIPFDASNTQIANILRAAKVITSTQTFVDECRRVGAEHSLKPGIYELETLMDISLLIAILEAGPSPIGHRLTIPEGLTVEATAAIVESACGIPQADFLVRAYAASEYVSDYPFLADVFNDSLEGFLFPKTYNIPLDASADYVVRVLLDQFALETRDMNLAGYAEAHGMNLYDIIALASLIEKETAAADERALVSSVIYNRLRAGWRLQIDATVVYALGPGYDGHPLLYVDTEIDSPYNTYVVQQLPVGPICSPSILSIAAAIAPADTDYYYYVLTSTDGTHTFCATNEEFEAARQRYNELFGIG